MQKLESFSLLSLELDTEILTGWGQLIRSLPAVSCVDSEWLSQQLTRSIQVSIDVTFVNIHTALSEKLRPSCDIKSKRKVSEETET